MKIHELKECNELVALYVKISDLVKFKATQPGYKIEVGVPFDNLGDHYVYHESCNHVRFSDPQLCTYIINSMLGRRVEIAAELRDKYGVEV